MVVIIKLKWNLYHEQSTLGISYPTTNPQVGELNWSLKVGWAIFGVQPVGLLLKYNWLDLIIPLHRTKIDDD